ncbi:phosphatase PAP2 family protein [bacterium]|nr:phosphatase PAP2 family protein [candidate division CSSED10-310 bacterium]
MAVLPFVYWALSRQKGKLLTIVFLFSMQLNSIVKMSYRVPRPYIDAPETIDLVGAPSETFSFPSGHAQGSLMIWGGTALLFPSFGTIIVSVILPVLVGISRMYLGVHSLLDVIAGFGIAIIFLIVLYSLVQIEKRVPPITDHWLMRSSLVIISLIALVLFYDSKAKDLVLSGTTLVAFVIFEAIAQNRWHFKDTPCWSIKIRRCFAGYLPASIFVIIYKLIPDAESWVYGLVFAVLGYWMAAGAPFLFTVLGFNGSERQCKGLVNKTKFQNSP